ncbi:MAG: heparin lyase I family protein [Verrucomicrobia bacterium]|nr:heparin lyase I family protein [Verrucomicrobiota bacterium]
MAALLKLLNPARAVPQLRCGIVLEGSTRSTGFMRVALFPLCLLVASPAMAREPARDDFEASAVDGARWRPSGPQPGRAVTTAEVPAFHGGRCLKVTVEPGDNAMQGRQGNLTERFELTLRPVEVRLGEEVWYAFALRVPADFPTGGPRTLIHQFKENVRPRPPQLAPGVKHCEKASPAFALYLRGGRELAALVASSVDCDHSRHELGVRPIVPGRWHEIVVHTRPAHDARGFVEVWIDGERLGRYQGIMGYVCHGLGHIDTQPRFGIYRDAAPGLGAATLYYDAIRFAATREGLQLR